MTLRRNLHVLFAVLATLLAASPAALAQDEEDPEPEVAVQGDAWDRILAGSLIAGLDTPFGIGGVMIEVAPIRYLAIYAGGGVGRDGGRFAGGLRLQFPVGYAAVGIMAGVTGGPLDWNSQGYEDRRIHRYWDMAAFLHAGITFEHRFPDGVFIRAALGVESLLAPPEPTACSTLAGNSCGIEDRSDLFKPTRGWAGVQLGYALDL